MEANQCRLNNIVNYRGQITTLTKNEMVHFYRFSEFYEPIPLTEEILLKCGYFKLDNGQIHYVRKGHEIWLCDDMFSCNKNGVILKSLHQLQNLYFALTNEELTVNL